jgi:hypothetical protein
MIPIVTIGLDAAARVVADRISGGRGVTHYDTAETAEYSMADVLDAHLEYDSYGGPIEPDDLVAALTVDKWVCHVIYGESAFGLALTATKSNPTPIRLDHTGYTLALVATLGEDPGKPRRVRDGQADARADHRDVFSATGLLGIRSFGTLDTLDEGGETLLRHQFDKHEAELERMAGETAQERADAIARAADAAKASAEQAGRENLARVQRGAR